MFKPLELMVARLEAAKNDSDVAYFHDLLLYGEFVVKLVAAGLISAIQQDPSRLQYGAIHRVVRADGVGEWVQVIDEIVTGPAAQYLDHEAQDERRQLTERVDASCWQHLAVRELAQCLKILAIDEGAIGTRTDLRRWLSDFARFRNKTRGHGAVTAQQQSQLAKPLVTSIDAVVDKFRLFQREWAFIHRNLSGKYFVAPLLGEARRFSDLKSKNTFNLPNGVYVAFAERRHCELLSTDRDLKDFYLPNGNFGAKAFEAISYVSGERQSPAVTSYMTPPGRLPESETSGRRELDVVGNCFSNMPPAPKDYVSRKSLEDELQRVLLSADQYPIVTLHGRGGIGKTSLALHVAHEIALSPRFDLIVWFSARDIDLQASGPRLVTAQVLNLKDVSKLYSKLLGVPSVLDGTIKAKDHFLAVLQSGGGERPLLIFDNFETVQNPGDLFASLDTFVRNPTKILITTRHREFKGDYAIPVEGMEEAEFAALVKRTADRLAVTHLIDKEYERELYVESSGHPYVAKMILGSVAQSKERKKVERIIASADEILLALFERTYSRLSPAAQRCFLTICRWRSQIPVAALEAVLLLYSEERFDVLASIEELEQLSFIEIERPKETSEEFINVPLIASQFGLKKLSVSPLRERIEADNALLVQFGATQKGGAKRGIEPHVRRIMRFVATEVEKGKTKFEQYRPMLEFLARRYNEAWMLLSLLFQEFADGAARPEEKAEQYRLAKESVSRFLENAPLNDRHRGWQRMAELCDADGDLFGELHARAELSAFDDTPYDVLSKTAQLLNNGMVDQRFVLDRGEKIAIAEKLAKAMWSRVDEADATDLSRLAWLYLHVGKVPMTIEVTKRGLELDEFNSHCVRLRERLRFSGDWR